MPCYDSYDRSTDRYDRENELKRRLDLSTSLLCGMLTQLTTTPIVDVGTMKRLFNQVPGLREWWATHQEEDRQREREEARQNRRAIKRLNKEIAEQEAKIARNREELRKAKDSLALSPHANEISKSKALKQTVKKRGAKN